MQCRVADRDAADLHRRERGERVERSGSSHGHEDVVELGERLARLELERDRPARIAPRRAETLVEIEPVDFDHDAVDLVVEIVAVALAVAAVCDDVVDGRAATDVLVDGKSERTQLGERFELSGRHGARSAQRRDLIGKKRQAALGRQFRVELAHAARRGVARIGKDGQARALAAGVERFEVALAQIDLAAYFGKLRSIAQA